MADPVQLTSRMRINAPDTVASVKELVYPTSSGDSATCQYFFDLAQDPTQHALVQTRFQNSHTQNIFIEDALDVFSDHKNHIALADRLEKFISILDNAVCLVIVRKFFIIQNNHNAETVFFLTGFVLKRLLAENFFQVIPLKELVSFTTVLPVADNQAFSACRKNILYCFYVRASNPAQQHWFVELIDTWQIAINNEDKIQCRYIENILMKVYPHILQGQAAKKWNEYIEKLAEQINQLRKDAVEKKFSDHGDAYLIMRQLQRLLEMIDRHPQHSQFEKRHEKLTILLNKTIQVNIAQMTQQLFNAENEMGRVIYINPGEIILDQTIHNPKRQLSDFNGLLWQWQNGEDFTHRMVAPGQAASAIKQLKFKFILPDQSFFYFHPALANNYHLLDRYDADGIYQGEIFRMTEGSAESIVQQAKVMLNKIEYEGLHLPALLIDFFVECLVLEDSFLYVHQQVYLFLETSAGMAQENFVDITNRFSGMDVFMKRPTHFVVRWNGEACTAAKLSVGDDGVADTPFVEIAVRRSEVNALPHPIHPLEKFNGLIELTFVSIPVDFSSENLCDLDRQSDEKIDDYSDRLFDDWAACVFLRMEKKLLLDRLDIHIILVQLARQLQARGYTAKKIKLTIRPIMKKWLKELYRHPTHAKELAHIIQQDIKRFFSLDFVSANKSVMKKNDFRTFYLMSSTEKAACLRNLAEMHAETRKRVADWVLRHNNEVKVNFVGPKFLDYLANIRNYLISRVNVFTSVIAKKIGRKCFDGMPIDLAVQKAMNAAQEAKQTKDKKSKMALHALLTLARQEDIVFTAEELYQLMTLASQNGLRSALKDGRNQKILIDAPTVLVNLYCYIKLAYPIDAQVMHALHRFLFSDPEFLLDFKEAYPKQYAQLMALKQSKDHTEVLQIFCAQGKKLLTHHTVFALFLTYAGKQHIHVLAQAVDPIKLMDCYLLLTEITDHRKNIHKNFLRLMSQTLCLALVKYPDGFFVIPLLRAKKIQYILPNVLVYLDQRYMGSEKINLATIIQAAGQHAQLASLFGENAAAFIIFLKFALPMQIVAVRTQAENLLSNNISFIQRLVENSLEELNNVLTRLSQPIFASSAVLVNLLREKIRASTVAQKLSSPVAVIRQPIPTAVAYCPISQMTLFHQEPVQEATVASAPVDKNNKMSRKPN